MSKISITGADSASQSGSAVGARDRKIRSVIGPRDVAVLPICSRRLQHASSRYPIGISASECVSRYPEPKVLQACCPRLELFVSTFAAGTKSACRSADDEADVAIAGSEVECGSLRGGTDIIEEAADCVVSRPASSPVGVTVIVRRTEMDSSAKDQIKGKFHEVKGKVKEKVGQVVNSPDLESEGKSENLAGKVQKKVGQIKEVFEK